MLYLMLYLMSLSVSLRTGRSRAASSYLPSGPAPRQRATCSGTDTHGHQTHSAVILATHHDTNFTVAQKLRRKWSDVWRVRNATGSRPLSILEGHRFSYVFFFFFEPTPFLLRHWQKELNTEVTKNSKVHFALNQSSGKSNKQHFGYTRISQKIELASHAHLN